MDIASALRVLPRKEGREGYFPVEKKLKKIEESLFESEQRFRLIIENLQKGILVIDKNALVTYVNTHLARLLGYDPEEMIGSKVDRYIDDSSIRTIVEELKKMAPAKSAEYEFDFLNKNGSKISTITQMTSLFDMEKRNVGILVELQDVSTSEKMEYKLHEKLGRLQKSELATLNIMEDLQETIKDLQKAKREINQKNEELQRINQELNATRDQLALLNQGLEAKVKERTSEVEMLLKQKDEFINQLGHDLKTPLTPLNALLPVAKLREHDPKVLELLDICISNVNFMRNLVERTLELARLNSPSTVLIIEDIVLADEVDDVLKIKQPMFTDKNITINNNISRQMIVQADSMQIKELFDNIIVNAMKYSAPLENQITIDAKEEGNQVVVSIQDNGIGLSAEQLDHVFHEFYKADSSRHNLQSTGLGLSICKRIVEKHGGKIWVESPGLGKGSTFYFSLPSTKKKIVQA
jgi:PAS domain S-box-containing protein